MLFCGVAKSLTLLFVVVCCLLLFVVCCLLFVGCWLLVERHSTGMLLFRTCLSMGNVRLSGGCRQDLGRDEKGYRCRSRLVVSSCLRGRYCVVCHFSCRSRDYASRPQTNSFFAREANNKRNQNFVVDKHWCFNAATSLPFTVRGHELSFSNARKSSLDVCNELYGVQRQVRKMLGCVSFSQVLLGAGFAAPASLVAKRGNLGCFGACLWHSILDKAPVAHDKGDKETHDMYGRAHTPTTKRGLATLLSEIRCRYAPVAETVQNLALGVKTLRISVGLGWTRGEALIGKVGSSCALLAFGAGVGKSPCRELSASGHLALVGGPRASWEAPVYRFCRQWLGHRQLWTDIAQDRDMWRSLRDDWISWSARRLHLPPDVDASLMDAQD